MLQNIAKFKTRILVGNFWKKDGKKNLFFSRVETQYKRKEVVFLRYPPVKNEKCVQQPLRKPLPLHRNTQVFASSPLPLHLPFSLSIATMARPNAEGSSSLRNAFGGVLSVFILLLIGVLAFSIRLFSVRSTFLWISFSS